MPPKTTICSQILRIILIWKSSLTRMSRRKRQHLKSPRSLTVSSASRSHSGCLLHQGILLTPIPFVPWPSGLPFPIYNFQGQRSPSQCSVQLTHFLSVSHQGILSTRARRFPLPDGPGQVKLPVGRVDLNRFFLFVSYKQIKEFQNSWSRASNDVDSCPFRSMTIGPPIPEIQFDLKLPSWYLVSP